MRHTSNRLLIVLFIATFFFFTLRGAIAQDPDFGWHYQFGQLVTTTGKIPMNDPFSYTMPSYHFVDHEWITDILLANVYNWFGMLPLIEGFALLGICALVIVSKGTEQRRIGMPLFLIGGTLFEFMGIRPQIITWVLLAVLASIIWQKNLWQRWRLYLPLLFLLWANIHGGFAIGIVVLSIFVIGQTIEKRRIEKTNLVVLFLSLITTLVNPYGYHLWIEVLKSMMDTSLRWSIQEWYPAIYFTNIAFWIYATLSFFLLIRYRQKFSMTTIFLYCFLLLSGLASMRNIPIFVIVSFFPTLQAIRYLSEEAEKHMYGKERFAKSYVGFTLICLFLFLPQLGAFLYGTYVLHEGQNSSPAGAVTYLQNKPPQQNIFSSYDWGGYLVWQLPEKKVFVDGRMPSWRNASAQKNESTYAFGEYTNILKKEVPFKTIIAKYHIDTVLVSSSDLQEQHLKIFGIDVEKSTFLKRFFHSNISFAPVVSEIKQMGWQEVYHDDTAVIFQKPGSSNEGS